MINYPANPTLPTAPPPLVRQDNADYTEYTTNVLETEDDAYNYTSDSDVVDQLCIEYREIYGVGPQNLTELMNWVTDDLIPALQDRFAEQDNPAEEQPLNVVGGPPTSGWDSAHNNVAVNLEAHGWDTGWDQHYVPLFPPITTDDLTDGQ